MQDPYDASDIFGPPTEEDDSETYFYNSLGKPNSKPGARFGAPRDGGSRLHMGGDWGKAIGTPVRPFAPGVVKWVGESKKGGKFIEVDHGNGVVSRYRHLSATGLAVGTPVGYGDTIGESGNTGTSTTGPHVHAEVLVNGKPVDPNSVFGKSLRGTRFEKPEFDAMDIFLGDNTPANPPADGVAVSGATAANPQTGAQGMLGLLDRMQGQAGEVYNRVEPQPGVTYNIEAPRPLEYGGSVEVSDVAPEDAPQWMDAQTAERMAMEAAYYPKSQGFEFGAPPGAAPEEVEQLAIQELAARAGATPEEAVAALRERGVTSFIDVDDPNTELPSIRTQLADPRWAGGPVPVQVGNDWVEAVKEYMTPRAVAGRKAQALTAEAATLPPGSPEALLKYTGARNLLKGVEDNEKMLALQDRETRAYGEAYDELVRDWGYPDDPEAKAQYIKRRRELNRQSVTDGMNIRDMGRDILQDDSLLTLPTRLPLLAAERGSEFIGDVVGSLDTSNGPATPLHEALGRVFRPTTHLEEETADTPGVVGGNIITGFDDALGGWARDETGRSPLDPRDSESDTSRRLDAKPVYGTTQHILGIGERAAGSLAAMDLTMKPLAFLKSKAIAPEEFSGLRLIEKAAKNEIQTGGATTLAGKKAVERTLLSDLGNVAAHPVGDTVGGAATLTSTSILADIAKDVISGRSLEGAATERIKTAPQEFLINMIMLAPGNILGRALAKSGVGLGKLGETIRMESQGRLNVKDLVREPLSAEFREAWAIAAPVLRGRTAIAAGGIAQTPAQTLTQAIANPDSVFDENGDLRAEDVIVNGVFNTLPAIMHLQERNTTKKGEIFEDLGQAEAGKRTRYRVDVDPLTGKKVTGIGGRAVAVGAEQFRAENLQTARALDKVAALKRKNAPIEDVVAAIDGLPDHIQDSILNEYSVKDADGFTSDAEQYMRMARAGAEMASDPTYLERRAQRVLEDAGGRRNEVDAEVDAELARAEGDFQNSLRTLYEQKNAEVDALETQRIPEDQVEALRAKIPELQTEAEAAQANLAKAQADYQITHDRLAKEFEQAGVTGADPKFIPGYQKKVALLTERANALKEAQANAEAVARHPDTIKELTKTLQDAEKTNTDIDKKIEDLKAKHQDLVVKRGEAYNKAVEAAENRRTTEREAVDKEAQAEATKLLGARDKSIADMEARKASGKPGGTPKLSETPRGEKSEPASGEAAAKAQRDIKNPEQMVSDIIDSDKGKAKRVYSDHILKLAQDARIPDFTKEDADSTATVIANTTSYIGKTLGNRKTTMEDVERLIFKGKTFRQAIKGIPEAPRKVMEDGRVSIPRGQFDPADQISTPRKAVEITIFSGGHADTVLHEFAHAVREGGVLPGADLAVITAWERNLVNQAKARGSFSEKQIDRYGGELFSHAFERYFTQGEVPEGATPELMGAMNHLRGLFNRILDETGRHLIVSKDQLSPEMRKFFDRFVSDKPELTSLSNPKFLHEGSDEEKFQVAAKGFVDRVFPFLEAMEKAGSRGDNRARANWIAAENDLYSMYDTMFPDRRKNDFYRDLYGSIDDPAVFDKIRFAESQRHRAENTRRDIEAAIELAQNAAIERRDIAALKQREAEILGIFDKEVDKLVVGENEAAPGVDDNTIKDILDGIEAEYAGAGKVAPQKKPFATKENGRASLLVDGIQHDIPLTEVQQAEWDSLERGLNDALAQDTGDTAENALARKKAIAEYEKGIRDLTGIKSIADLKAEQAEAEKAEADAQKALAEAEKQVASEAAAQAKAEKAKKAEADRIINDAVKERDARRAREDKEAARDAEAQRKLRAAREKEDAARLEERRKASERSEREAKAEAERQRKAEEKLQRAREKAAAASEKARRAKIAAAEKEARVAQATPRKKKITQEEADELKANARSNPAAYVDWNDWKVERYGPRGEYVTMLPPPGHPIRDQWEKAHQDYIAETEALKAAVGRGDLTYERAVAKVNDAQDALFEARNRLGPSAKEWAKARWPELEQPIRMPTEARREAMRAGATAPETVGKWKGGKAPDAKDVRYQDPEEFNPLDPAPEFYSPTERAIEKAFKNGAKGFPAEKTRELLLKSGAKGEELADLGIDDLVATSKGKKISKEDLLTVLNANRLQIEEKTLGPLTAAETAELDSLDARLKRDGKLPDALGTRYDTLTNREARIGGSGTVYHKESLRTAGGDEYRELLFKLPSETGATSPGRFEAPHFNFNTNDGKDLLAHGRIQTRNLDGKDYTEVLEVQSDWHQAGRDQGYYPKRGVDLDKLGSGTIADAPLKDSWHKFVLKKMLLDAVKNGHAGILINDGQIQADRYSLDKELNYIGYSADPDKPDHFFVDIQKKDGTALSDFTTSMSLEDIKELLGKEWAQRITNGEGATPLEDSEPGYKLFEGDNLKVEAKGMRVFYDETLPNWLNRYAREQGWNVKVEPVEIEVSTPPDPNDPLSELRGAVEPPRKVRMWKFDIPEEVSASIRKKGQPLYQDPNEADPLNTPEFKNFFKNSEVSDAFGKPLVVSHYGHVKDIEVFDRLQPEFRKKGKEDDFDSIGNWFADKEDAKDFGPEGYDVYLSIQNPKRYTSFQAALDDFSAASGKKPGSARISISALKAAGLDLGDIAKLGLTTARHPTTTDYVVTGGRGALERLARRLSKVRNDTHTSFRDQDIISKSLTAVNRTIAKFGAAPQGVLPNGAAKFRAKLKADGFDGIIIHEETGIDRSRPQTYYVTLEPNQIKSATGNRGTYDPADPNIYHQDPNEADPLSDMQLDAFGTNAPAHSDSIESLQDELARIRAQIAQREQRSTALLNESAKRMDTNFYRAAFREIADMSRAVLLSNPAVHSTNLSSLVINTVANDILAKPVAAAIDRGASLIFGLDPSLTFSYKPELLGAAQMVPKGRGNRDLSKYGGVDEDGNPVRFTKEWREKNLWDLNAWTRAQRVFRGDPLTEEYERVDVNWFDKQNRKEMPKALRIFATPLGVAHAYSKTIYGILGAEDAIAYSGHLAKHIATEAITRAKAEAKDGGPTFKQLYDFYSNDPTLDMVERANMHALIATFNNSNAISKSWRKVLEVAEEKGNVLGPPIRTALQFAMPFVQTPSNIIFYEGPSWLGLGIPKGAFNMYRAYKGQKGEFKPSAGATPEQIQKEQQKFAENQKMAKFYQQRAAQQGAQGVIGLAVLAGLAQGLNGYFEPQDEHFMPAFDFNDPQQRDEASAMREAGQGYSGGTIRFKFNGEPVTINMNQIGPTGAIAYAAAGIGSHIRRGENEKAIQGALQQLYYMAGSHPLMQDTPLVSGAKMVSDWGENLSKSEDKKDPNDFYNLSTAGANISKRLFPPLAFGSLYGDYTDTEDREAKTLSDKMLKMLPWERSKLPVRMSKLNPDETVPKPTLLPRVGGINVDKLLPFGAKPDLAAMDKARATIAETQVLPRKVEPKKDEKPEDFEKRRKEYYAGFRKVLEEVQNDPEYLKLPRHETNDVDHILEDLKDPNFKPVTRRDYLQLRLMGAGLFGGKPKVKRAIVE